MSCLSCWDTKLPYNYAELVSVFANSTLKLEIFILFVPDALSLRTENRFSLAAPEVTIKTIDLIMEDLLDDTDEAQACGEETNQKDCFMRAFRRTLMFSNF